MKIRSISAALAAALLLTGCFRDDVHEFDPLKSVGYFNPVLNWSDLYNAGTPIRDLTLVIDGPDASFMTQFPSPRELAREPLEVPAGENTALVVANVSEADGFSLAGLPPTKSGQAEVRLLAPRAVIPVSQQVWAASCRFIVEKNRFSAPSMLLRGVLPLLQVNMHNVPDDIEVTMVMENLAAGIILSATDTEGHAGVPDSRIGGDFVFGAMSARHPDASGRLLPTASGQEFTRMQCFITQGGIQTRMNVETPRIEVGGQYVLNVDFDQLVVEMSLGSDTVVIRDWTSQGDPIGGDIFKPEA